jgi:DNA (cytosine-5)-methyltransferase 1
LTFWKLQYKVVIGWGENMTKPLLYDVFCGAGGATKGYQRAGFRVIGIDNKPQKHYCGDGFILMDAIEFLSRYLAGEFPRAAAFAASPPCQRYSAITKQHGKSVVNSHPDLIEPIRSLFLATGKPFVIENVVNAPLLHPVMLCGSMFNLHSGEFYLQRHRLFECSWGLQNLKMKCAHPGTVLSVYGHAGGNSCRDHRKFGYFADWRIGMGIDWMTRMN